ncbi:hypothetical protein V8E53_015883, partial [Lactarius tabidus]
MLQLSPDKQPECGECTPCVAALVRATVAQSRIDVLAKHCLNRLAAIAEGPRGKPPSFAEIETASGATSNPSTFEDADLPPIPYRRRPRIQLGKGRGIFRVPGESDVVTILKMQLDSYMLEGVDDPHGLASLFKLWLRARRPTDAVGNVQRLHCCPPYKPPMAHGTSSNMHWPQFSARYGLLVDAELV